MGRLYKTYLSGSRIYSCSKCHCHLTKYSYIISKQFRSHGKAYLFSDCVNIYTGSPEDRILLTGVHTVVDIFCRECKTLLGWKYEDAFEDAEKYKVGKFILEKGKMSKEFGWSDDEDALDYSE